MAIQIIKPLTTYIAADAYTSKLISAYNVNKIRWTSDSGDPLASASIKINGLEFVKLVGVGATSSTLEFEFDIQEVVKTLLGRFEDVQNFATADIIKFDETNFLLADIRLTVVKVDTTTETLDITSYLIRAVRQHTDLLKTCLADFEAQRIYGAGGNVETLALLGETSAKKSEPQPLRIFKGYPFSISVIGSTNNERLFYFLTNNDKSITYGGGVLNYTPPATDSILQRLVIGDGATLSPVFASFPSTGSALLTIQEDIDGSGVYASTYAFYAELVDECGIYLKWLNRTGGWSYWLFSPKNRNVVSSKSRGTIDLYGGTLSLETDENNIGYDVTETFQIVAERLPKWALLRLLEIASSPCVYYYLGKKGEQQTVNSWLRLPEITPFKYNVKSETDLFSIGYEFRLPTIFTQTL